MAHSAERTTHLAASGSATARPEAAVLRRPSATGWVGAGFILALALVAVAALGQGIGREGIQLGLRLTARLGFLLFWPSYAAGALVILFGDAFLPLKRRARAFGLAFAVVLAVHLGLVSALCAIGAAPSAQVFIVFGPGAAFVLLLAIASIDAVGQTIGVAGWWLLRNVGMNYLAFDFAVDFLHPQPSASFVRQLAYLPFATLAVLGPGLRLLAWLKVATAKLARG